MPRLASYFRVSLIAIAILSFFVTLNPANAQDLDDATISGRVTDQNGAVIPGAIVTAILVSANRERTMTTDGEGRYRLIELKPGTYTVRAMFTNFAVEERRGVETIAAQNVQLDFTLRPAEIIDQQVVVSEANLPLVDTARTVVGGTVTREEVESLPNTTRSPLNLIFTLGGVTEEPLSTRDLAEDRNRTTSSTPEEAGIFALSGGPAYSNNITIDGLDNNDDRAARERFQPSLEAIEEVQVITNQFSAEYGRASGGRVNIRTRAGSNRFRGRAFYFFRDESLNANTFRNNSLGLSRLPLQQHNPGFTLSGPAVLPFGYDGHSRRTFFFVAYEYDTVLDTALIDTLVPIEQNPLFPLPSPTTLDGRRFEPSATAPNAPAEFAPFIEEVSTPSRNHIFTARVDHNYTETHNASFNLQLGRLNNLRQFGGGLRLAEALQGRTRNSDALSYTDNYVFSATTINQLRAQISRLTPGVGARGGNDRPVVLITINDPLDSADPLDRSGTLVAGSSTAGATDRRETRFQIQDTLSFVRGAHSIRFGGDFQHIRSTFIDLSDASGTYNFTSAGDFLAGAPSRFRQNFHTESTQTNTYMGLFVQDEWRIRPNLVFSYGLRYENETIISDRNNFAPRVALAYDPFGTGRMVIRAGAGMFYNRVLLRTIDDFTLGTERLFFDTNALRDPTTGRVLTTTQRRAFIAANLRFPETLTVDSPLVRQFAQPETSFSRRLSEDIRIPESYQFNVGIEREVGRSFVFEANYTFNRGIHLWREFNANAPRLPEGFDDFSQYLLSRDFANFRNASGTRPLYDVSTAGEIVRFIATPVDPANPNAIVRITERGVPVSLINLNSISSSTAIEVALAALNDLRPDPTRGQIEELISVGNSFYHGLTLEMRRRFRRMENGLGFSLRAAYTLSRLIDDGIVNTSSALTPGDFRAERARSILDRRHRFVFSGTFDLPRILGALRFSPILRLASGAPFNISIGGADRNLDDVSNDRPFFNGDLSSLRSRRPRDPLDPALLAAFSLPTLGQTGNLPRNAGLGPGFFLFDINITREFRLSERMRLRPVIEIDNVLNRTVFSFGTEFINFSASSPTATPEQRKAFLDSFLVPTRTLRPRQIRIGLRFDF
jgi:hypothetical protein